MTTLDLRRLVQRQTPLFVYGVHRHMKFSSTPAFVKYALIWYSEQFAIPFWVIGHVHLYFTSYHATVDAVGSMVLHLLVGL